MIGALKPPFCASESQGSDCIMDSSGRAVTALPSAKKSELGRPSRLLNLQGLRPEIGGPG